MSRKRVVPDVICSCCGKQYHPHYMRQALASEHYCSQQCQLEGQRRKPDAICPICGKVFVRNDDRKTYCSRSCADESRKTYFGDPVRKDAVKKRERRNRMANNGHHDIITLDRLIMRDKNTCHICGKECDKNDCSRNDSTFIVGKRYPSVDHVIPLCSGGTHTWSNVMLAHVSCNSRKGRNSTPPGHPF